MSTATAEAGQVFLTDGTPSGWIGPYLPGDLAIATGSRWLREVHGATEVFAVRAPSIELAKATYRDGARQ